MRTFRLVVLAGAIAITGSFAGTVSPASAGKRPGCFKAKGSTIKSHNQARVFKRGDRIYGCMRGRGPRLLSVDHDDGYVTSGTTAFITLAGNYVAFRYTYVDASCKAGCPDGYDGSTESLTVRNLVSGRETTESQYYAGERFVLTKTGAAAWISGREAPRTVYAFFMDTTSEQDTGNVQAGSLEASRSRVTWMRDGVIVGVMFG